MYTNKRIVKGLSASMEERKNPQEDLDEKREGEEYSFLQEVIKDEADSIKVLKNGVFRMIGYGVVFGLAASIVFCAAKPWIENRFNSNPTQIEIPKDEEEKEKDPESESEQQEKKKKTKTIDADSYRYAIQKLSRVGKDTEKCMAVIGCVTERGGQEKSVRDSKAGIIIADNGRELLILSHILNVKKNEDIQATFADGRSYKAAVKVRDLNLGFCVYGITREMIDPATWSAISTISIGSSNSVENGDPVIVLGKPFGEDNAVSYGTVAADEGYVEIADGHYRLIYTNIPCDGNGSGAILNRYGQLIGVIDQSVLEEGSNGRVGGYGISDIKDIIELLSNGAVIPYTGIYGMDVTEKLTAKGMPQGVYVREVAADSPAMAAGIQSGDVIVGIDGEDIGNLANYHNILLKKSEGSTIKLRGCRQGAGDEYVEIDFEVIVGSRNKD